MEPLTREDLLSLEDYEAQRGAIQERMRTHKALRRLDLDPHVSLFFEDRNTMWYQVQEMARAERLFRPEELDEELGVYNPLIPDGTNLKATLMIQYDDRAERDERLRELVGIEDHVWIAVAGHDPVYPFADEDLERSTPDKTSTVHFLRFELPEPARADWKAGERAVRMGIDHPGLQRAIELPADLHGSLAADFD